MAIYASNSFTNRAPTPGSNAANAVVAIPFTVTISAALTTADTVNFGYVPAGFRLLDAILESTDMDTNGTPLLTISVGDEADTDRIFAASTAGQAGTVARATLATGIGYEWAARTLITGLVAANAATGVAGTLTLTLIGYIDSTGSTAL